MAHTRAGKVACGHVAEDPLQFLHWYTCPSSDSHGSAGCRPGKLSKEYPINSIAGEIIRGCSSLFSTMDTTATVGLIDLCPVRESITGQN